MRNPLLPILASSLLFIGCTASGSTGVSYSAEVSAPAMVYIDSDVRVIADHDEPIFYTNSYYWRQTGGVWYRSSRHNSGWVAYSAPAAIVRIQTPSAYVRYRASSNNGKNNRPNQRKHDRKDKD
jgi:hypothetical protein